MKVFLLGFLLVIAIQSHCFAQRAEPAADINLRTLSFEEGKRISFVRFSLEAFDLRVLTPLVSSKGDVVPPDSRDRAARGLYLAEYARRYEAAAVSSGGYIDSYSPPTALGFVKSYGVTVSRGHDSWLTEGIVCADDGRVVIELAGRTPDRAAFRDCLQAGPLLLKQGRASAPTGGSSAGYQKLAKSIQEQTFVCTRGDKEVIVGVSSKLDIPTLAGFLTQSALECNDALRLTGLDTSGLRLGSELFNKDDYLFPNALGVIRRRK